MKSRDKAPEPENDKQSRYRSLRTWPAALILCLMAVCLFVPGLVDDGPSMLWAIKAFGPLLCCVVMLGWWVFVSDARWFERILAPIGLVGAAAAALSLNHKSMVPSAALVFTIPLGFALFALTTIVYQNKLSFRRTLVALLIATLGFSFSLLLQAEGMWGNFSMGFKWRWVPRVEEQLLVNAASVDSGNSDSNKDPAEKSNGSVLLQRPDVEAVQAALLKPEWSEFRGGSADNVFHGPFYARNWSSNPPKELWRIQVGPAWSSFVVAGPILFSQEQRGDKEAVVCYDATSGKVQWISEFLGRFEDDLGGPGPRSTPVLQQGKLFAQGANGILARIDPMSGRIVWEKDLKVIANRQPPMWGFSASPVVVDSLVIAYAGGNEDRGLLAFDIESGELKWSVPSGKQSYSSPQLFTIQGKSLIGLTSDLGLHLYEPSSGKEFMRHSWEVTGYRACQPHLLSGDRMLLPSGMGFGTRLLQLNTATEPWTSEEVWTSRQLKPDFNDFVIYKDHIYGFDASIFTCVSLKDGIRQWKGGRYGKGQVALLEESGLLLVASEDGDLVLVAADPTGHQEVTRMQVFKNKVWNHPVVVGDKLYIRNAEEAVCFQLPVE
jgi:hypothetical protein